MLGFIGHSGPYVFDVFISKNGIDPDQPRITPESWGEPTEYQHSFQSFEEAKRYGVALGKYLCNGECVIVHLLGTDRRWLMADKRSKPSQVAWKQEGF